ncbi:Retrovirus-related Pol polyprotein from transposon TNT 1-94 [Sesbania bispinosa]|nr:Retrovirus-related Pol polyprotein from transposon TNT 1-94 [Sesbania bispinosa]
MLREVTIEDEKSVHKTLKKVEFDKRNDIIVLNEDTNGDFPTVEGESSDEEVLIQEPPQQLSDLDDPITKRKGNRTHTTPLHYKNMGAYASRISIEDIPTTYHEKGTKAFWHE